MLEPIKDVFEIWNQYLLDAYIAGLCMIIDGQLVPF